MPPEVWVAIIAALSALAVSLVNGIITGRGTRRIESQVSAVHEHTVNSHTSNLRVDVDVALAGIRRANHSIDAQGSLLADVARDLSQHLDISRQASEQGAADKAAIEARLEEQAQTIARLAEALPIVARSTPPVAEPPDPSTSRSQP